jgi:hypothetical protein
MLVLDAVLVENEWMQFILVVLAAFICMGCLSIFGRRRAAALGGAIWLGGVFALGVAVDRPRKAIRWQRWYAGRAPRAA